MLLRDIGFEREIELAHAAPLPPEPEMIADGSGEGHAAMVAVPAPADDYLSLNRRPALLR